MLITMLSFLLSLSIVVDRKPLKNTFFLESILRKPVGDEDYIMQNWL